jgi:hypothetical protein
MMQHYTGSGTGSTRVFVVPLRWRPADGMARVRLLAARPSRDPTHPHPSRDSRGPIAGFDNALLALQRTDLLHARGRSHHA